MNEGADEKTEKNKNLTKALAFLFSKEAQEISIEEKKKFLLTKLPKIHLSLFHAVMPEHH